MVIFVDRMHWVKYIRISETNKCSGATQLMCNFHDVLSNMNVHVP